jgi:formylglycine-generating enzyme required for sulfatase activity
MSVPGHLLNRIYEALKAAFNRAEVQRMVRTCMDQRFSAYASDGGYDDQLWSFVEWADRTGRIPDLVKCAHEFNPHNSGLAALYSELSTCPVPPPPNAKLQPGSSYDVFIAYSEGDKEALLRLTRALLVADIVPWEEPEDFEPSSPKGQRTLQHAITNAHCVIALLSPEANDSELVQDEITYAGVCGLRIFPVMARGKMQDAIPLKLINFRCVDMSSDSDSDFNGWLIPTIKRHLKTSAPAQSVVLTGSSTAAQERPFIVHESKTNTVETAEPDLITPGPDPSDYPPLEDDSRAGKSDIESTEETGHRVAPEPIPSADQVPVERIEVLTQSKVTAAEIGIEWVTIHAGEFLIGSDPERDPMWGEDETPQHRWFVDEFRMSKYPVTNGQYLKFIKATGYPAPKHFRNGTYPKKKKMHPVVYVSWHDAVEFCRWAGVRLPTEEEWEKAARGENGLIWPWGNDRPTKQKCNCNGAYRRTTSVRKYPDGASPYGVMDMAGNVWEWTSSPYIQKLHNDHIGANSAGDGEPAAEKLIHQLPPTLVAPTSDVSGQSSSIADEDEEDDDTDTDMEDYEADEEDELDSNKLDNEMDTGTHRMEFSRSRIRVIRGGSWESGEPLVRCAARYWHKPSFVEQWCGFRVAVSISNDDGGVIVAEQAPN